MARFDRIKEEIGWLKLVFGVLVAIDASLIAWLAQNHDRAGIGLLVGALLGTTGITAGILWVSRETHKRFVELEKL